MNDFRSSRRTVKLLIAGTSLVTLVACDGTGPIAILKGQGVSQPVVQPSKPEQLAEQDIEAPSVFQVVETGLWDGRPSLGGTWVAHPDVTTPERVIIRNTSNGQSVTGALFRREVDNPGPKVQVSSDAAAALGMLAGQPVTLSVTALRRDEVTAAVGDLTNQTDNPPDPL